jgi:hypothetical protein
MNDEEQALGLRERVRATVAAKGTRKPSKKAWEPPTAEDFAHGTVLAFDQTVTKSGFAMVRSGHDGLWVVGGDLLVPKAGERLTGFEQTLVKAVAMHRAITLATILLGGSVDAIVHEMPAVQGYRIESSLMAAMSVRIAAGESARGVPIFMVSNQSMRAILNHPDERYEKKHVGIAIDTLIPRERRTVKRWNQDVHDAVGLALAHLYQKAHKS